MSEHFVYVVSGAARGIGFEFTTQLLHKGQRVIAGVRSPESANDLKRLQAEFPENLQIEKLDISSDESVKAFRRKLEESGVEHVDVLINNAGISLDSDNDTRTVSSDNLIETMNTNTVGPLRLTQALLPLLTKAQRPRVANISSLMGSIGDNSSGGSPAYRISKTAVNMLTKSFALDVPEVTTLAFHPGWVQTRMGGPSAPLAAEASAAGLLQLIEDATPADSGKFLNYDGAELNY